MSTNKLLRVIALTFILVVTLVGQGQAQGQPPLNQPAIANAGVGSTGILSSAIDAHNYIKAASGDVDTLDPALAYDTVSGEVIQNVYETLVFYDGANANAFVPQLASSYELSVDGLTWTFHIRTGVTFHNGDSLTPADVAYSFQRGLLQGGTSSPQWLLAEPFFGVGISDIAEQVDPSGSLDDNRDGLKTADPAKLVAACEQVKAAIVADNAAGTVTMHLAQPWGPFLGTIAGTWGSILDKNWSIAQGAWDGSCLTWQNWYATNSGEDPLTALINGTGPFKLDHWTPGVEVVLARNNNYWRTPAQLGRVEILNIPDENTRFTMLQNGNADEASLSTGYRSQGDALVGEDCIWNVNTDQYDCSLVNIAKPFRRYMGRPGISQDEVIFNFAISVPDGGNPYIGSGVLDGNGVPPDFFSDVHVRKAFNDCFNWDTLNEDIYGGTAVQPTTLLLEGMPGYDLTAAHYTFNPTQAALEFKASTLTSPTGGSLWDTGFHIQMLYNEGNPTRQVVAQILAANIYAVNPKFIVDVVGLPWPNYLTEQRAGTIPIMTAGWMEDIHDPHNWYQPYLIGAYGGRAHVPDSLKAQFKTLIDQGVAANGFAARDTIYKQLNQLIYNNAMFIFMGGPTNHNFVQRRVHGLVQNPIFPGRYYYMIYKDPSYTVYLPMLKR
jgi:peptide/nickel transport system substrate-binding protein